MGVRLRRRRKLWTMDVKTGVICSKDCLKWPLQSLQPFLCTGTFEKETEETEFLYFLQALT